MPEEWMSLLSLRRLGVTLLGDNIKVSKDCRMYNPKNIILHNNIRIDDFTILSARGKIELFNYVHIASHCLISSSTRIECRNFTGIASGSKLFGSTDDFYGKHMTGPLVPNSLRNVKSGDIILEDHVLLGSNTIVMPSVIFGEGSAIGSMSFVTKNTEPWCIYTGVPAKKMCERNDGCCGMALQLCENLQ